MIFYNHSNYNEQNQVFCRQLEVALKTDYPVVIHSREAEKETIKKSYFQNSCSFYKKRSKSSTSFYFYFIARKKILVFNLIVLVFSTV